MTELTRAILAEDGRYVHNVNVSAFISNLPGGATGVGAADVDVVDVAASRSTQSFGTRDASGSTSQAANVIEALESGASAMLVDEDVSAANFMARDGRMRAMIMDEPITPLLYRVNGLYLSREHGTSTVVVVGGVGEWLDVADAVVLMRDYVAYDGLAKARSVSYQFSYGHVQYAGRGVVHRLPWKFEEETRKNFAKDDEDVADPSPSSLSSSTENATLSPLRRRPGCHCVAKKFKDARALNDRGMNDLLTMLTHGNAAATTTAGNFLASNHVLDLWTTVGFAYRPRRHEVAMALTRMRGMKFDSLPEKPKVIVNELSPEEDLEESKKRALAALWANRRKR
ncbi:hypothetical protein ACHAW5_009991 [Stephanodiscus triporus]|uniref:ATPase of the ABC class C-terminal domain-containing protein n=1 Tax=Stephanodiscus triporus TaxID=2934178 RepID=A0ABD3NYL5_9STRA